MAFGSSLELDIVPAKEKGETSKMPTMKIKKSHANPKAHHKTYFYCPSKQANSE